MLIKIVTCSQKQIESNLKTCSQGTLCIPSSSSDTLVLLLGFLEVGSLVSCTSGATWSADTFSNLLGYFFTIFTFPAITTLHHHHNNGKLTGQICWTHHQDGLDHHHPHHLHHFHFNLRHHNPSYWTDLLDSSPGLPCPDEPREDMEEGTKNGLKISLLSRRSWWCC